jgi:hypothetical protein
MAKGIPYLVLPGMTVCCTEFNGDISFSEGPGAELAERMQTVRSLDEFRTVVHQFSASNYQEPDINLYAFEHLEDSLSFFQGGEIVVNFRVNDNERFVTDYTYFQNGSGKTIRFLRNGSNPPYLLPDGQGAAFYWGGRLLSTTVEGDAAEMED